MVPLVLLRPEQRTFFFENLNSILDLDLNVNGEGTDAAEWARIILQLGCNAMTVCGCSCANALFVFWISRDNVILF